MAASGLKIIKVQLIWVITPTLTNKLLCKARLKRSIECRIHQMPEARQVKYDVQRFTPVPIYSHSGLQCYYKSS